jgi:hypothetical protein
MEILLHLLEGYKYPNANYIKNQKSIFCLESLNDFDIVFYHLHFE